MSQARIKGMEAGAEAAAKAPYQRNVQKYGWGGTGLFDATTGTVIQQPAAKPKRLQAKAGTLNGQPALADFDPETGKYYHPDTGEELSGFMPKEADKGSPLERAVEGFKKNGANDPDYKAYLATEGAITSQRANINFSVQNPAQPQDQVSYIADQVEQDPTGMMLGRLTGSNKKLRQQVTNELKNRDSDLRVLTPATRQLGETAHTLMPDFDQTIKMLQSPSLQSKMSAVIGPRWQEFLAGTVGKGDPEFDRLRVFVNLLQTGTARAHIGARGSVGLQNKFENLFNANKMDAATLRDSLSATRDFLKGYDNAVYGKGSGANAPVPPGGSDMKSKSNDELFKILMGK